MAGPKTTPTTPSPETPKLQPVAAPVPEASAPPAPPDDVEAIRAQLLAAEAERDALLDEKKRAGEAKAAAETPAEERRVVGTIPVYNDDQPHDVVARAREVRAGKIPADKATRFRTDANIRAPRGSKLAEKYRVGELVPVGTELHRDDIPAETRAAWCAEGALIPIG